MKQETHYSYQKRIKELEAKIENLRPYRDTVIEMKNWLVPFAGDKDFKGSSPNASYGLNIIFSRCLK